MLADGDLINIQGFATRIPASSPLVEELKIHLLIGPSSTKAELIDFGFGRVYGNDCGGWGDNVHENAVCTRETFWMLVE